MIRVALFSELYAKRFVLLKILTGLFLFAVLVGMVMHRIEPDVFATIFDGVWWAIVTISTVGYGDYVPVSLTGRLLGILLILTGIGIFSYFITNLAASTMMIKEKREKGDGEFKNHGHLLIVGWNERSRRLIRETHQLYPFKDIVMVDETLQKLPSEYHYIRFIKGSPREDETLQRANLQLAETVVITANLHIEERLADANTILTLIAMRGLAPDLYTIAEIITHDQVKNAKRAGADEVIEASHHVSMLLMNSTLYHGLTDVVTKMLDHNHRDHLCLHRLPEALIGKSFAEAVRQETSHDQFLLGVRRDKEATLHPHPADKFFLQKGDELIYVKR
ncbi:potassium channel family protein [Salipaludibacillus aurantiacus]|uniref:Voltage-gated potassium channel n=1 Tax=Salipaludibacillus aurantiacus TaxID=1601833 RepID=A0A1H9WJF8_9BACI|nr:potassium channel family protein [Salipaludibacillus aurantiacus]SES33593.1 voltage-gated potassium channel [Salipaludibacillus aurantiacus]